MSHINHYQDLHQTETQHPLFKDALDRLSFGSRDYQQLKQRVDDQTDRLRKILSGETLELFLRQEDDLYLRAELIAETLYNMGVEAGLHTGRGRVTPEYALETLAIALSNTAPA